MERSNNNSNSEIQPVVVRVEKGITIIWGAQHGNELPQVLMKNVQLNIQKKDTQDEAQADLTITLSDKEGIDELIYCLKAARNHLH